MQLHLITDLEYLLPNFPPNPTLPGYMSKPRLHKRFDLAMEYTLHYHFPSGCDFFKVNDIDNRKNPDLLHR